MRVLLVDDHRLLLEGLNNLLTSYGIEVVGLAKDGNEAVALTRSLFPDVILMDIRMPRCDGLEATRRICAELPNIKIVILTTSAEDNDLFEAVKSGAYGYLLKSMDSDELVEALNQVQEGIPPFSPSLAGKLLREFTRLNGPEKSANPPVAGVSAVSEIPTQPVRKPGAEDSGLTARECEVLALVAQGLSYKEVGARLHLSPRTVKYHMSEIMARLHLENRAQVLAYAGKAGLTNDS